MCTLWHLTRQQNSAIMGLLLDSHVCRVSCGIIRALLCPSPTQSGPSKVAILCNQLAACGFALTKIIQTVVSTSISDSASIFGKDGWWEAFESGYILKQLGWSQLISPRIDSRTVSNSPRSELPGGTELLLGFIHIHFYSHRRPHVMREQGMGSTLWFLPINL